MKALFLVFHGFSEHNGISKKIHYQVEAMRQCGVPTELSYLHIENGKHFRMSDDKVVANFGSGVMAKIFKRIDYRSLTKYILNNKFDMLYIRSAHNANPFLNVMLKKLHKASIKIVLEIPTYPYEGQFKGASLQGRLRLSIDKFSRNTMAKYIDKIVTFTDLPSIFGRPTISISNGIDFSKVPLKKEIQSRYINFLAVAELHFWHGFDRMIEGINKCNIEEIRLHIVGDYNCPEGEHLRSLTEKYNLGDKVIFHGALSGEKLDQVFDMAHFGIASLARHRSNITHIKTLKNREYAARGLAFIYSEIDDDFENKSYIIKAQPDESPIDINKIINFYRSQRLTPQQIRDSIKDLSWEKQMQKVIDNV